jgi:hypothetical protein
VRRAVICSPERQFDGARSQYAEARISTQVGRPPEDLASSSCEMATDVVESPPDTIPGIEIRATIAALGL